MNVYAVIVLVALLSEYLLSITASLLNLRAMSPEVPTEFLGVYEVDRYAKSQEYTHTRTKFGLVQESVRLAVLLAFWQLGGFGWLDRAVRAQGWGEIGSGLLFVGGLMAASGLIGLPFQLYSTFFIEERFGFNRTTLATFWSDQVKALMISVVIGGLLLSAVLFFFAWAGGMAWLWCWAVTIVFMLATLFVGPTWIMPLFNKFSLLNEGVLQEAILGYARSVGFPLDGIFVIDGSRRSSKANAFFTGFGRHKRIALYDTLIAHHTVDELVAVVAHEVGHYKRRHVFERLVLACARMGAMFWLLSFFIEQPALFAAFGVSEPSVYAGLVFFGLLFTPIDLVLSVAAHVRSRQNEFAADEFAVQTTGSCEPLVSALKKLSVDTLSNLTPHSLTVALSYSHPPLLQRIAAMRKVAVTS
jgi:STE24 endopeptidase